MAQGDANLAQGNTKMAQADRLGQLLSQP
jgi:hypothetical protein